MKLISGALGSLIPSLLFAGQIIVSADRIPSLLDTTSNEVYSFQEDETQAKQGELVWQNLQKIPGLTVSNNGGQGQSTTLSIRGADSRHSLVLFEGVELNDASTTGNLSDLSQLSFAGINTVEILPGSQSVLYGSDAIGGVLSLNILELDKIKSPHFIYNASIGSNKSHTLGITHYNSINAKAKYYLNISQMSTDGFNQTSVLANNESEEDGHFLGSVTGKFLFAINENHKISLLSRLSNSTTDLDKGFGSPRDDTNYESNSRNFLYKLESKHILFEGLWEPTFSFSSVSNKRSDEDQVDSLSSTISTFESRFKRNKFSNQNNFHITKKDILITGYEFESESGNTQNLSSGSLSGLSQSKEESNSIYFYHKRVDQIFWSTGFRVQEFNDDTNITYKIAPGIKFKSLRSWISFSTGFKNPSLFQRNSSSFGNKNLLPEESKSLEWGNSLDINKDTNLSLVFYKLDIENLIDTTGTFPNITYVNLKEANTYGLNVALYSKFAEFSFSRQNATDSNGFQLINRPKVSSTFTAKLPIQEFLFKVSSVYKGPRDSGSSFTRTRLPGFTIFNSHFSYEYRETLLVWFALNNFFDKKYTDITGYNTDGINFKVGFNWSY